MKRISVTFVALAAVAGLTSMSRDAHALGPVGAEVGLKVGAATNTADNNVPNPLGFGIGGRGGVTVYDFYAGLNVMYYVGGSGDISAVHFSNHTTQFGAELGYGFKFLLLTIRPQIGLGDLTTSSSISGGVGPANTTLSDGSDSRFYVEPGLTGIVGLGLFFVGADANVLIVPGSDNGAGGTGTHFTFHGQLGIKI